MKPKQMKANGVVTSVLSDVTMPTTGEKIFLLIMSDTRTYALPMKGAKAIHSWIQQKGDNL